MLRKTFSSWEDILLLLMVGAVVAGFGILAPRVSFGVGLDQVSQGSLLVRDPDTGGYSELPRLDTDVRIAVTGPIARSRLTQRFRNPSNEWVEALYAFPLPEDAAVDTLRMVIGDRIVEGQVQEKREARATYDAAKQAGKKASLVEQHRPNLFSSAVANIPPNGEIEIQIELQQRLHWLNGKFSLRFPLAITPRYVPARDLPPTGVLRSQQDLGGGWQVLPGELSVQLKSPAEASDPTEPVTSVRIGIDLMPGFSIGELRSLYHAIDRSDDGDRVRVALRDGNVQADRDFVLEWSNAESARPVAAFFTEATPGGDYGLLLVAPPTVEATPVPPREVTFVIDTSGSMGGESLVQAKAALLTGLDDLGPADAFNVIEFNSVTRKLFAAPRAASASTVRIARRFVGGLEATGGTEILPAFADALDGKSAVSDRLRQIIFITDGAVGNERDIFQFIRDNLGDHRLFMIGIGSAPNSHFMVEGALFGRGTYTHIGDTADVHTRMSALFEQLKRPVLTDLALAADGVTDVVPGVLPDLYAGEPIALAMKLATGPKKISLTGRLGATLWRQDFNLLRGEDRPGLRVNWARGKIQQVLRAEIAGQPADAVRQAVTALALEHHLVSKFTSLVAVDVTPSRPSDAKLVSAALKNERVAGMSQRQVPMAQTALGLQGRLLLGLALLAAAAFAWAFRRRRPAGGEAGC